MAANSNRDLTINPHPQISARVQTLAQALIQRQWSVTAAESCTGGGVAQAFTAIAGSSQWFECGFVTYSNRIKSALLGVEAVVLDNHGAVSQAVVEQMAIGAAKKASANASVAISGIAGPDGGTAEKPVGTVWMGWAISSSASLSEYTINSRVYRFSGDREAVRTQAVLAAIEGLIQEIEKIPV